MIFALAMVVAVASAIRSTWSPCGVSMLSTITPLTESVRGNRFRSTAIWYLLGALAGGATFGGLISSLASVVPDLPEHLQLLILSAGALVAVASDGRLGGFQLPGHDRQVNERWLDVYRPWVYGAGFGWQIGFGLATYIMTAGVYLLVLVAALGSPVSGLILGVVFGLVRGMAVFAASEIVDSESMAAFHRSFEAWRQPIRKSMIGVLAVVGIVAGLGVGSLVGVSLAVGIAAVTGIVIRGNRETTYRISPVGESH